MSLHRCLSRLLVNLSFAIPFSKLLELAEQSSKVSFPKSQYHIIIHQSDFQILAKIRFYCTQKNCLTSKPASIQIYFFIFQDLKISQP